MDFLRQLAANIAETWRRLSVSARVNIVLWGMAVAVVLGFVVVMGSRPQYVTLSERVEPKNQAAILSLLTENNIPYRLRDNEQTVEVPMQNLSEARMQLAQANLPVGRAKAPGFELFNQSDLMTNRYMQDVQFMRALQGELETVLNDFDFIEFSRVIIREAKDELFRAEEKPAEALVTLQTNRRVAPQEIKGILNLVAQGGGPNLDREHITIMTTSGEVLASPPDSKFASIANSKREYIVELERERESRVLASLRDLGVRATVRVSAQVDFDEKEITEEKAEEGPAISTYTSSTTTTSTDVLPEGAPGVTANIAEGATPGGARHQEETTETIENLEPSYTRTTTKKAPGNVLKYLVALVVEGDYEETQDGQGNTVRNYVGLPEERKKTYIDLARMAVGDGDVETEVVLHDHPFEVDMTAAATAAVADARAASSQQAWLERGWLALQAALIVAGFWIVRRLLRRAVSREAEEEVYAPETPRASPDELHLEEVTNEVVRMSRDEPETVSALLRTWMVEEEE